MSSRYTTAAKVDDSIAKALGLSEVAQVARTEARMVKFFMHEWNSLTALAAKKAEEARKANKNSEEIIAIITKVMEQWAKRVRQTYIDETKRVYFLSRTAAHKKATMQGVGSLQYNETQSAEIVSKAKTQTDDFPQEPEMDETDKEMAEILAGLGVHWVDDHYDMNIEDAVKEAVRGHLAEGQGSLKPSVIQALTALAVVGGFRGPINTYLEGLVANSFATTRMSGHLRSFMEIGVTHYTISVTVDERTCGRCLWMDGKTFSVEDGARVLSNVLTSTTAGGLKSAQPWLTMSNLRQVSTGPGFQSGTAGLKDTQSLSNANFVLPPFHFRCRCTVDISREISTFEKLTPLIFGAGFISVLHKPPQDK